MYRGAPTSVEAASIKAESVEARSVGDTSMEAATAV